MVVRPRHVTWSRRRRIEGEDALCSYKAVDNNVYAMGRINLARDGCAHAWLFVKTFCRRVRTNVYINRRRRCNGWAIGGCRDGNGGGWKWSCTICGRIVPVPVKNREKDKERRRVSVHTYTCMFIVQAQRS